MIEEKVIVTNPTGLHLRPAGNLCKKAAEYKCSVHFVYENQVSNAKSVLSVLGAGIRSGYELTLICDGEDEETAIREIADYIRSGLGDNV